MQNNVQNVKAGEDVFYFPSHEKYPDVALVTRVTNNFVFIERMNYVEKKPVEVKFRRDGSGMDRFDGRLATIEPGDIEQFEQDKKDEKRIGEIISLLDVKGFRFKGHSQWYSIEQWEKLAAIFNKQ